MPRKSSFSTRPVDTPPSDDASSERAEQSEGCVGDSGEAGESGDVGAGNRAGSGLDSRLEKSKVGGGR